LSSTSDRSEAQRGQVLVIFVFSLVALLAAAALVFDVGQDLLDRRDSTNAADAASLAGARFLDEPGCKGVYTNAACPEAVDAAIDQAKRNGIENGKNNVILEVKIPPGPESAFSGRDAHIEVLIRRSRSSFFAGVIGMGQRHTGSMSVAANLNEVSLDYSLVALHPDACNAGQFGGNGSITVDGKIQVNSTCSNAFKGNGANIDLYAEGCSVTGGAQYHTQSDVYCPGFHEVTEGVDPIPDPLGHLDGPAWWDMAYPAPQVGVEGGSPVISGCPDGLPESTTTGATLVNPQTCRLGGAGAVLRIYPGLYPGGIRINGHDPNPPTVYMEPGIYYLAGGGFSITGGAANVISVKPGGTTVPEDTPSEPDGAGIMFFNSEDPIYHDECMSDPLYNTPEVYGYGTRWPGCMDSVKLAGGGGGTIYIEPTETAPYAGIVIFQDKRVPPVVGETEQPPVMLTGGAGMKVKGTVYAAEAEVKIDGNGDGISAQIISATWSVQGNGNLEIPYDASNLIKLNGLFLVE
jgi:hypothetical protein